MTQTWQHLCAAIPAAALLCRVAVALRFRPFPQLLDRFRLRDAVPEADAQRIEDAQANVQRAHRLVPLQPNCLLDSLAAAVLLRRQGYSVPLAIGVKLQDGNFLAHAWLGSGAPAEADGFRLLYRVPGNE